LEKAKVTMDKGQHKSTMFIRKDKSNNRQKSA
jgi:hypothetical protein